MNCNDTQTPAEAPAPTKPAGSIFLVGLMGAGKTTIGRLLSRHREQEFVDSDYEIVARCGDDFVIGIDEFRLRNRRPLRRVHSHHLRDRGRGRFS